MLKHPLLAIRHLETRDLPAIFLVAFHCNMSFLAPLILRTRNNSAELFVEEGFVVKKLAMHIFLLITARKSHGYPEISLECLLR